SPRRDPRPVSLVDVAPTVVARLGLPVAAPMQGLQLPRAGAAAPPRPFYASGLAYGPPQTAVVVGDEKEIAIDCPERLLRFDLRDDPAEKRPRDGSGTPLTALLARYRAGSRPGGSRIRLSSEKLARLRSLGYLRDGSSGAAAAVSARRPESVGIYDPRAATFALYPAAGTGAPRFVRFGASGDVPVVGDWDGDGVTDLGVFEPAAGAFRPDRAAAPIVVPPEIGAAAGDLPLAGDWDGDGIDTVAIYRPSIRTLFWADANRADARWLELHAAPAGFPVSGKWRCAGRSGLAFFTPDARFDFAEPNVVFRPPALGEPGDLPVAGDWDGDGTVTVGVYRPATGEFLLRNRLSGGAPDLVVDVGVREGIPVAGRWATEAADSAGAPRERR
ncbi:MAG TPA: hypothetical protein VG777_02005, partial [Thermoanaerobaculia bacterium]|nr:hypothetical protein [Thermoanaerobaculia bacterium]